MIPFTLKIKGSKPSNVKLWIENASGKTVAVLINAPFANGSYQAEWSRGNHRAGVYYAVLSCNGVIQTKKMFVVD